MGVSSVVIRGALPGKAQASPVECGEDGATIKNNGPNTTYYRDESPVSAVVNDGLLASGESATLYGTQYFVVDEGASASALTSAALIVTYLAAASGGGGGTGDADAVQAALDDEVTRATGVEDGIASDLTAGLAGAVGACVYGSGSVPVSRPTGYAVIHFYGVADPAAIASAEDVWFG